MAIIQVVTRAGLSSIIPVNGHIAPTDMIYSVGFDSRPDQLLDIVPFADIRNQIYQGIVCLGTHKPVRGTTIVGNLDGYRSLVISIAGSAPAAVGLINIQSDPAIAAYAVVAGRLSAALRKQCPTTLYGEVSSHAVYRNGIDTLGSAPRMVGTKFGVGNEAAVTHPHHPPFHPPQRTP